MVAVVRVLAASAALLATSVAALGTNYEHDGTTTYCWAIPRRTDETKLTEADRTTAFSTRAECPMALTLSLAGDADSVVSAFDRVNVTWRVQVDFGGAVNAINNTRLYLGPDSTGKSAQIVHSNVHSCVFGTGCDPFSDGEQLVDKTVNKIANFSDNAASFSDSLQFTQPGEYSVLAHIILPNFNASSRFDYAVYTKVTVLAATVAIVVGAIVIVVAVAVIVVLLRRRRGDHGTAGYTQAPVHDTGHHVKHSDVTNTNSTTGFESAWGGGGGTAAGNGNGTGGAMRPTTAGLDNTNYSNASSSYAAPTLSDGTRPSDVNQFSSAMQQQTPLDASASAYYGANANNQGQRKKRIDSDVEL